VKKYGKEQASSKPGEFNTPRGIATDNIFIYVCDRDNDRVQVLKSDNGEYHHCWGIEGTGDGQFQRPYSITYSTGLLYVGDNVGVQIFTQEGKYLHRLGKVTRGSGEGEFDHVLGLCIVEHRLFISDYGNSRIQVLEDS